MTWRSLLAGFTPRKNAGRTRMAGLLTAAALAIGAASGAHAALKEVGPTHPVNGFPTWYSDSNDLALELCLDPLYCFFDPVVPGNAFSETIGLGGESFWWGADAAIQDLVAPGSRLDAVLVLALEAAFTTGDPAPGQQFPFSRVRIRVDTPVAGTYTVTHPYGVEEFVVPLGLEDDGINMTRDIGAPAPLFSAALTGDTGPFLVAVDPPPPPGFIGNFNIEQTVTGSPFGTNYFEVCGPEGSDLGGPGNDCARTDLFAVQGKVFPGTPSKVTRATYGRTTFGQADVFATAPATAAMSVSGGPNLPAGATAMAGDGAGGFFGHVPAVDGSTLPATITVTADNSGANPYNSPSEIVVPLVDFVRITAANWDPVSQTLTIAAASSDEAVPPVLTATGWGELVGGVLTVQAVFVPPATVTVTSSAGGSDTEDVHIAGLPVAVSSLVAAPAAPQTVGTPVTFTATANGGTGSYEFRFWLRAPGAAFAVVQEYSTNASWVWDDAAAAPGAYTVWVEARRAGSTVQRDAELRVGYVLNPPAATGVTLTPSPASPQLPGAAVTFTAAGQGGSGTYEYRFFLREGNGAWVSVQPYGPTATWQWDTTGRNPGSYRARVDVRSAGSSATQEASVIAAYDLLAQPLPPATGVTLFSSVPSPQPVGTAVVFAAQGQGGTGSYEYRFMLREGANPFVIVQNYGTAATWQWSTAGRSAGDYRVRVDVRRAGSTATTEASQLVPYTLAP